MKLLAFTDLHWRGTNPRGRTDTYPEAARRKLAEIQDLAIQHDVDAVLFMGDLTDTPHLDHGPESDLMIALRQITRPIYAIWGNTHDIPGDNPNYLRRTTLNVVESAGLLQLIRPGQPVYLDEDGMTVQISGQGYHQEMDRRDWRLDYCVYPPDAGLVLPDGHQHWLRSGVRWSIHLVHGMLRTSPLMHGIPVTIVGDVLTQTRADVTLSGHDHGGYGIVRMDDRVACNPGAIMRKFADRVDMERPVQVVLITMGVTCQVELIPLTCAAPGEEVLDRSQIDEKKREQGNFQQFVAEVQAGGSFEAIDTHTILERIAETQNASPEVRKEALERVAVAQEAYARKTRAEEGAA